MANVFKMVYVCALLAATLLLAAIGAQAQNEQPTIKSLKAAKPAAPGDPQRACADNDTQWEVRVRFDKRFTTASASGPQAAYQIVDTKNGQLINLSAAKAVPLAISDGKA